MSIYTNIYKYTDAARTVLCAVFLLSCAVQDVRSRRIRLSLVASFAIVAALLNLWDLLGGGTDIFSLVSGLVPGLALWVFSRGSGGAAGEGDGIALLIVGALAGAKRTWILAMAGLLLAAIWGMGLLALRRGNRKTRLPFLAFVAAAGAGILAAGACGVEW